MSTINIISALNPMVTISVLMSNKGHGMCYPVCGLKEMFYLTALSTHFIYGYMASGIW